jgi:hypothetical protein
VCIVSFCCKRFPVQESERLGPRSGFGGQKRPSVQFRGSEEGDDGEGDGEETMLQCSRVVVSSAPGITDEGSLGVPPTSTIVYVLSILDLTNCPSYLLYLFDSPSLCLSRVTCFSPLLYYLEKVSHWFRYKILSLPSGQLDSQPVKTQLQERGSNLTGPM